LYSRAISVRFLRIKAKAAIKMQTVCIIGGGPSGLGALNEFHENGEGKFLVTCLEKQNGVGGLWHFDQRTGDDCSSYFSGQPVHGSMYLNLTSNGPKECLEYMDYSFAEHFGKQIGSFPPREVLFDYIRGKFAKVIPFVSCGCEVYSVVPVKGEGAHPRFEVAWTDANGAHNCRTFDYIVVATGHFSTPNVPNFEGLGEFKTKFGDASVIHATNFRDGRAYRGKNILTVGGSYSAEDIVSQCVKYDVANVTMCARSKDMSCFPWPANVACKKNLKRIDVTAQKVYYADGTSSEGLPDNIILCTGYVHSFPFLSSKIAIQPKANKLVLEQLYKGIFLEHCPRVMYLGMQDQWFTFSLFLGQATYMLQCIKQELTGNWNFPSLETMQAHTKKQWDKESKFETDEDCFGYQGEYLRYCFKNGACSDKIKEKVDHYTKHTVGLFAEWEHHKHEDIMGFRDYCHASHNTPTTKCPKRDITWMQEQDFGCMSDWLVYHDIAADWQTAAPTMTCTDLGINFDKKREPDFGWMGPVRLFEKTEISKIQELSATAKLYDADERSITDKFSISRGHQALIKFVEEANPEIRVTKIVREQMGLQTAFFKLHPNAVEWAHLLVQDVEASVPSGKEKWHLTDAPYVLVTNVSESVEQVMQLRRNDDGAALMTLLPGQSIFLNGSKVLHCGRSKTEKSGRSQMLVTAMAGQSDDSNAISFKASSKASQNYPTVPAEVQK
jgi:trimethylamine monooxygenase